MPEAEAMALRDRIIDEIEGMDEIPESFFVYKDDLDLEVGDSPLVISPGWQAAYDEWDHRWLEVEAQERQNHVMSVGEGNVLMANDHPVISAESDGFFANITTPDGFQVLWRQRRRRVGGKPGPATPSCANWKRLPANSSQAKRIQAPGNSRCRFFFLCRELKQP